MPILRRLTRMMLTNLGVKSIYEAADGIAALDAIRNVNPDVMIMDWEMPVLDGREVMRIVRSPGDFPKANLPIIMLTDLGSAVAGDRPPSGSACTSSWSSRSHRRRCSSACSASCSIRGRWCAPASSTFRCRAAESISTSSFMSRRDASCPDRDRAIALKLPRCGFRPPQWLRRIDGSWSAAVSGIAMASRLRPSALAR